MFGMPTFQSQIHSIRDLDLNFLYLCYDARSYMGMLLASTLVMKLIDACRERIEPGLQHLWAGPRVRGRDRPEN